MGWGEKGFLFIVEFSLIFIYLLIYGRVGFQGVVCNEVVISLDYACAQHKELNWTIEYSLCRGANMICFV